MSQEVMKSLSAEQQQAFAVLRTDTRPLNGRHISLQEFDTMRAWVDTYKHLYNVPNPPAKLGGLLSKKGWVTNAQGEQKMWILQYDDPGRYMSLVEVSLPKEEVIVAHQAHSVATSVHQALQPEQTSLRQTPLVSAEMKVLEGESIKFFGANGRVQRLMVDDILAQKGLTLAKLFNYAKAAAEPDIAIRFLERYFDEVDDFGVPEFPEGQLQELNDLVASMNGKRTQVPDYCATRLAKFHIHKSADEIVESVILLFRRGSQACLRITLLEALGQKVKKGEVVAPEKIRALWKEGREETFVFLKYLTKEQREEVIR